MAILALIAVTVAGVAGLGRWRAVTAPARTTAASPQRLAILPIATPGGDADLDILADGMTENLIHELSTVRSLQVTSRTSSMFFKNSRATIRDIARQLGVDFAIESTLQDRSGEVELEMTLVDTRTDRSVWTRRFAEPDSNLARLEADAALELLRQFGTTRPAPPRPVDNEAYRWYLKGLYQWNTRTADGLRAAKADFEKAIDLDPGDARAHAGLAQAYLLLGAFSWMPAADAFPRAEAAAKRALDIDPAIASAHAVNGYLLTNRYDVSGGYSEFLRALEHDPSDVTARHWYALSLMGVNPSEAVRQIEIARQLDPLSRIISSDAAVVYKFAGRRDDAIQQLKQTIGVYPDFAEGYVQLGNLYEEQGDASRAADAFDHAIQLDDDQAYVHAALVHDRAAAGDLESAHAALARLQDLARHTFVPPGALAIAYGSLGDREAAKTEIRREASLDDIGKAISEANRKGRDLQWLGEFAESLKFDRSAKKAAAQNGGGR